MSTNPLYPRISAEVRQHGHTLAWATPHTAHDELAVSNFSSGYIVGKAYMAKSHHGLE